MIVNSERHGFVLAAVLLALLLIAALVAGVVFASGEATRMGIAAGERQRVLAAAEAAVEGVIAGGATLGERQAGVGATMSLVAGDGDVPVAVYLTRLDSTLFWIVADAGPARAGSGISSRIGALMRLKIGADGSISATRISERWWSELF